MVSQDLGGLTRRTFIKGCLTLGAGIAAGLGALSALEAKAHSLFVELNDDNYKSEILDYKGPALALFYDGNYERSPPSKNEYEALNIVAKEFAGKGLDKFNGLPIKFGLFDINQYYKLPSTKDLTDEQKMQRLRDMYAFPGTKVPVTFMYAGGKVVDIKIGGPTYSSGINREAELFAKFWIPSNLANSDHSFTFRYQSGSVLRKVLKST